MGYATFQRKGMDVLEAAAISALHDKLESYEKAGARRQAAAGAADGALGLVLPRASGSRCRRKATRHDLSRSAATRRVTGTPVTAPARLAPAATQPTTTTASTATASMAARWGVSAHMRTASS
jgi:hypothetical protein